jgi:hypothetical protein
MHSLRKMVLCYSMLRTLHQCTFEVKLTATLVRTLRTLRGVITSIRPSGQSLVLHLLAHRLHLDHRVFSFDYARTSKKRRCRVQEGLEAVCSTPYSA